MDDGEKGVFDMVATGNKICTAYADHNDGGTWDYAQAACSGLVQLEEGELSLFLVYDGKHHRENANLSKIKVV